MATLFSANFSMLKRILFTIAAGWQNRKFLQNYRNDPSLLVNTVLELDPIQLKKQGFLGIVLDFDGVLASHGECYPEKELISWLKICSETFGNNTYILTNKPTLERQAYFREHYPTIQFVISKRKKPYPDALKSILAKSSLKSQQLVVVDDRLLTGILATILVGAHGILVVKPKINLKKRPIQETFFIILRKFERWFF